MSVNVRDAKTMTVCTIGALVLVSAYSAGLGDNGWAWSMWVILLLVTLGVWATRDG